MFSHCSPFPLDFEVLFYYLASRLEEISERIARGVGFNSPGLVQNEAQSRVLDKIALNPNLGFEGRGGCTAESFLRKVYTNEVLTIIRTQWIRNAGFST